MLFHYLLVAKRNLIRQRSFSAINIVGLALGMTCFLLIFLWVQDEKKKDNFHENAAQLYTIYQTFNANGELGGGYPTPDDLAEEMKKVFPEMQYATSYATGYELPWGHPETFQVGEKIHKFEGSRAGKDFFKMFSYELAAGTPEAALKDITSLSISRRMAELFFGTPENALGKTIRFENYLDFEVTGVFENVSSHSSLQFDYLINWEIVMAGKVAQASVNTRTFVQLEEHANANHVANKIKHFRDNHIDESAGYKVELGLQPYGDQYLQSNFVNGKPNGGRIEYVRIFSGVAIFILLIACINFMNLATARSMKRAKEVGVRKVVGSSRYHLLGQFFGESILLSFLAFLLSLALLHLILPTFNAFTDKQMSSSFADPSSWVLFISLVVITGIVAGSYPALFLSSLKPVRVLKGVVRFTSSAVFFRKGLAVFQFSLSIILLIATFVVSRQTDFVQNSHLGYDRENLIYVRLEGELQSENNYLMFKELVSKMPGIASIDRTSEAPHSMSFGVADAIDWDGKNKEITVGSNNQNAVQFENRQGSKEVVFYPSSVGYDFLELMNLSVVEGRGFSREFQTDSAAFMINETAVKQMGIKDPIGKWISAWDKKGHIIGVLKDFHIHSFHEQIKPVILDVKEDLYFGIIMIRTEPGKTKEALASLETVYKDINPSYPFTYQFLDQEYDNLYRNEKVLAKLSNVFAIVAIIISCLGLLGLVMFSTEQRIKEIGIRKVLGATELNIVNLLSKDFLLIVLISFCIAAPVAGYFMDQWLQGFAFKIDLSWWIFALAGATALFIALFTISVQAIQAAIANPTKSLKVE